MSPDNFQKLAISHALEFYARHRKPVNRAYTPKNMMMMAQKLTGLTFKPRDYTGAATALRNSMEVAS